MFQSNLSKTSRKGYKLKEQGNALKNIKFLYKAGGAVIKLFNNYSSITFAVKCKSIHGKGRPSDLAARLKKLIPKICSKDCQYYLHK